MEPKMKRPRLDIFNKTSDHMSINCVLPDDYSNDIPLEKVYIAQIENTKRISSIIVEIGKCLPIESLHHLKRVRKKDLIICTKYDLLDYVQNKWNEARTDHLESISLENEKDVITELMQRTALEIYEMVEKDTVQKTSLGLLISSFLVSKGVSMDIIKELQNIKLENVPSRGPKLRWQYETMNVIWPCKFHPDKYMESLYSNTNFTDEERNFHIKILSAIDVLSAHENNEDFGICIDPRTNSIVAIAPGMVNKNPIRHCPMVLIDFVARTQNGGVWDYEGKGIKFALDEDELSFKGLIEKHLNLVRDNFEGMRFGAQKVDPNCKFINLESIDQDNLNKYGPYLCTGYSVYLSREPCLMCAMALVHSRVRRVFYKTLNPKGALGSCIKLHTIKDLNHRFEVFYCPPANISEK